MENARYMFDFVLIPRLVREHGANVIYRCLSEKEAFMAELFNNFFSRAWADSNHTFQPEDFKIKIYRLSDTGTVIYISLPREHGDSRVFCTAYAIAFTQHPDATLENIRFLTVEESIAGTTCIGSMSADGGHRNYGTASPDIEENVAKIWKIYST